MKNTIITINRAFTIGRIESNKEVMINLSWTLCEINLKGRRVLRSLRTFKKFREDEALLLLCKYSDFISLSRYCVYGFRSRI